MGYPGLYPIPWSYPSTLSKIHVTWGNLRVNGTSVFEVPMVTGPLRSGREEVDLKIVFLPEVLLVHSRGEELASDLQLRPFPSAEWVGHGIKRVDFGWLFMCVRLGPHVRSRFRGSNTIQ